MTASLTPLRADQPGADGPGDEGRAIPAERPPAWRQQFARPERDAPPDGGAASAVLRPARTGSGRGATTLALAVPEAGPVGRPEAGLDRRTAERLRKGARMPDARIDLHGMTAERAHRACLRFLGEAVGRGYRVVLVITGKGRRDDLGADPAAGAGVLRQSLPGWLRASPLGGSIIGIYQAHRRHGGEGAFYVYLKRRR